MPRMITADENAAFDLYTLAVIGHTLDGVWPREVARAHLALTLRMLAAGDEGAAAHMREAYFPD